MKKAGVFVVFLLVIVGCSTFHQQAYVEPGINWSEKTVAVLPLQNHSLRPDAGIVVSEYLYTGFMRTGWFDSILEPTFLRSEIYRLDINLEKMNRQEYALEVAQKLGVDGIFYGVLAEYDYQHNIQEDPTVSYTLHYLDVESEKVMISISSSRVGKVLLGNRNLGQVVQEIVERQIQSIGENI